jgi:geranylgeranyl pyrophosphate synthase
VEQTGKPGDDLRHGKQNAVVAEFQKLGPTDAQNAVLESVWGRADASDEQVLRAAKTLAAAGTEVEARLGFLADEARSALAASPFDRDAKQMLEEVTRRLTDRGS